MHMVNLPRHFAGFFFQALVENSRLEVLCEKDALKNLPKFLGKHLSQACNVLKKWFQHRHFPVNYAKLLRTPCLQNASRRLIYYRQILRDLPVSMFVHFCVIFISVLNFLLNLQFLFLQSVIPIIIQKKFKKERKRVSCDCYGWS